ERGPYCEMRSGQVSEDTWKLREMVQGKGKREEGRGKRDERAVGMMCLFFLVLRCRSHPIPSANVDQIVRNHAVHVSVELPIRTELIAASRGKQSHHSSVVQDSD